jgi:hypothetical protein
MPTSIIETATAAIAARLAAQVTTATVERSRRAPVDTGNESFPLLVLSVTDWTADETAEPLTVHYTLSFAITGYARAPAGLRADAANLAADQALSELHAAAVAAMTSWTPTEAGLGEPSEEGAERGLYDAEESAQAAGEFTARFSMLCLAPLGSPYAA